jgi:hypothetical protein
MLYLSAMKVPGTISEKKQVIHYLLLAILSACIFLLPEAGASRLEKETVHVSMHFQHNSRNVPGIYEIFASVKTANHSKNSSSLILRAISKKTDSLISQTISRSIAGLPSLQINTTQHFRSRSLASEDPFISFS